MLCMGTWRRGGGQGRGKTHLAMGPWSGSPAQLRPSKRQKLSNVKKRNVKYAKVEKFSAKERQNICVKFKFNLHNRYNYSNYTNQNLRITSTPRRATFYSFSILYAGFMVKIYIWNMDYFLPFSII